MRYKLRDDNINFMFTEGHNIPLSSRKIVSKISFASPAAEPGRLESKEEEFWKNLIKWNISFLEQGESGLLLL